MSDLSDKAIEEFDKEEMDLHYRDGFCEVREGCEWCRRLQYELDYWADFEEDEKDRIMKEKDDN